MRVHSDSCFSLYSGSALKVTKANRIGVEDVRQAAGCRQSRVTIGALAANQSGWKENVKPYMPYGMERYNCISISSIFMDHWKRDEVREN